MKTYHVPIRFDANLRQWEERGRPVYSCDEIVVEGPMGFPGGIRTVGRFELKRDPITEEYTIGTWFTVAFPAITFNGLRAVVRAGLLFDIPCGTFLEARLNDGVPRWWDGSAWVTAGAGDWSDPQDVMEQIGSWVGKTLGVEFRIKTDDPEVTPKIGGADFFLAIEHTLSSTDETIGSSWGDDALLRSFAPAAEAGMSLWQVDEFMADDQDDLGNFETISYTLGVGDAPVNVAEIGEVYDLTVDPNRSAPLVGVWDPVEKVFTLHDAVPAGNRVWVRLRTAPRVVLGGNRDLFTRTLPVFAMEAVREGGTISWTEPSLIVDVVNEIGYRIAAPDETSYLFDVAALARTEGEAWEAIAAFTEWVGAGIRIRSNATGRYFDLQVTGDGTLNPRGDFFDVSVAVRLSGVFKWSRNEEAVSLFIESEIETDVPSRRK